MCFIIIKKTPPKPKGPDKFRIISKKEAAPKVPKRKAPCRCPMCGTSRADSEDVFSTSRNNLKCKFCGTTISPTGEILRYPT